MGMIGITDRYDGFVWINPMNVDAVYREDGLTMIRMPTRNLVTSIPLDDVIKLIEQELTK